MLAQADLSFTLPTPLFKDLRKQQRSRLTELEEQIFEKKRPVVIVFEGWDASGKGHVIRELTRNLDPRGFKVFPTQAPRTLEKKMPWLWRFWMQIPRRGQVAIFDRSWYGRVLVERVEGLTPMPDWIRAYEEINTFERTLAADHTVFIKYWLHISEKEQLARFIHLSNDPMTAWEISAEDWVHHQKYKEYEAAVKDMLENTHTAHAPWTVISATDENYATYAVYCALINTLEKHLGLEITHWKKLDIDGLPKKAPKQAKKKASPPEKAAKKKKAKKSKDKKPKEKKAKDKTPKDKVEESHA